MKRKAKYFKLISNLIILVLFAALGIYLLITWQNIPDTVPTHFNWLGEADAYGSKSSLVIVPLAGLLVCGLFAVIENFPTLWNLPVKVTDENKERLQWDALRMLCLIKILLAVNFVYMGFGCAGQSMMVWPEYVVFGLVFVVIVLAIIKMNRDK